MFKDCENLTSLDLSGFDTRSTENMTELFSGCKKLESIKFGENFITSKVKDMNYMFENCISLTQINLLDFDTQLVTTMEKMFYSCNKLSSLDLSSFDTESCSNFENMFGNIPKIVVKIDKEKGKKMKNKLIDCDNVEFIEE